MPITNTRTGMAICGILSPVSVKVSLMAAAIEALSHAQTDNLLAKANNAGFTASVTCCAFSSALGTTST